ncbi:MAG: 50S ribosomal protein L24 [Nitrospirota bacterium]
MYGGILASIRKNDTVMVIAGKEKGKKGRILSVNPGKGRVIVEKLNIIKKHQRPTQKQKQGGIVEKEGSINISNIMLICGRCEKPTRVAYNILEGGKKVRVCKNCGEAIDKG